MDLLTFSIGPVAPFRLDVTVWVLRRRAENALDRWDGRTYRRALLLDGAPVELAATGEGSADRPQLSVVVSGHHLPAEAQQLAAAALDRMLGLSCTLNEFYRATRGDAELGPMVQRFRGLKPTVYPTVFETLVNAIACQQMTLTFGIRLLNRLSEACGRPVSPREGAPRTFPEPEDVLALGVEHLRALQFSQAKAHALMELSAAIVERRIVLDTLSLLDNAAAVAQLTALRGVGRWTAEYVLLRGLGRLQVFPCDDIGARNNLGRLLKSTERLTYGAARSIVARWDPFAGLVYFHLLVDRLASRDPELMPTPGAHGATNLGTKGSAVSCNE
ncbi:MAG: DNA-3-methyladenine glycosylase [Gammaproteobacteria bacterium]